jgi:hypothetical protein
LPSDLFLIDDYHHCTDSSAKIGPLMVPFGAISFARYTGFVNHGLDFLSLGGARLRDPPAYESEEVEEWHHGYITDESTKI